MTPEDKITEAIDRLQIVEAIDRNTEEVQQIEELAKGKS